MSYAAYRHTAHTHTEQTRNTKTVIFDIQGTSKCVYPSKSPFGKSDPKQCFLRSFEVETCYYCCHVKKFKVLWISPISIYRYQYIDIFTSLKKKPDFFFHGHIKILNVLNVTMFFNFNFNFL